VEVVITTARLGHSFKRSPGPALRTHLRPVKWPSSLPWQPDTAMTSARPSRTPPSASP
jgi:hypothetical protein